MFVGAFVGGLEVNDFGADCAAVVVVDREVMVPGLHGAIVAPLGIVVDTQQFPTYPRYLETFTNLRED